MSLRITYKADIREPYMGNTVETEIRVYMLEDEVVGIEVGNVDDQAFVTGELSKVENINPTTIKKLFTG